jgi:hypothetical protein
MEFCTRCNAEIKNPEVKFYPKCGLNLQSEVEKITEAKT